MARSYTIGITVEYTVEVIDDNDPENRLPMDDIYDIAQNEIWSEINHSEYGPNIISVDLWGHDYG